jgi:hypothetical protein
MFSQQPCRADPADPVAVPARHAQLRLAGEVGQGVVGAHGLVNQRIKKDGTMDDASFSRMARGLVRAASMSADALAAEKGEGNPFVRIKRNSERLDACEGHDFEPDPDWRTRASLLDRKVHCRACGGDMKNGDALMYLRGLAHGSGRDFTALTDAIWPPSPAAPSQINRD